MSWMVAFTEGLFKVVESISRRTVQQASRNNVLIDYLCPLSGGTASPTRHFGCIFYSLHTRQSNPSTPDYYSVQNGLLSSALLGEH